MKFTHNSHFSIELMVSINDSDNIPGPRVKRSELIYDFGTILRSQFETHNNVLKNFKEKYGESFFIHIKEDFYIRFLGAVVYEYIVQDPNFLKKLMVVLDRLIDMPMYMTGAIEDKLIKESFVTHHGIGFHQPENAKKTRKGTTISVELVVDDYKIWTKGDVFFRYAGPSNDNNPNTHALSSISFDFYRTEKIIKGVEK